MTASFLLVLSPQEQEAGGSIPAIDALIRWFGDERHDLATVDFKRLDNILELGVPVFYGSLPKVDVQKLLFAVASQPWRSPRDLHLLLCHDNRSELLQGPKEIIRARSRRAEQWREQAQSQQAQ